MQTTTLGFFTSVGARAVYYLFIWGWGVAIVNTQKKEYTYFYQANLTVMHNLQMYDKILIFSKDHPNKIKEVIPYPLQQYQHEQVCGTVLS